MAHLVTSHQGEDHVTSANDAHLHAGQIGNGQYAFKGRGNFECSMINTNTLRIMSGDAQCNGYHWEIPGDYEEVTIENGSPGYKRIDLVVADITTAPKEECRIIVIKGEEIDERVGEPTVPSHIEGDLRAGDTHVQVPICSVQLNGVNTDEPQMLMDVLVPYAEFRDSQSQAQSMQLEVTGDVLIDSTHSWSTVRKGIEIPDGYRYGGLLGFAIPANTIMRQCYAWEYPDDHRCAVEMDFTSLGGAAVNATATVWVNLIPISRGYL